MTKITLKLLRSKGACYHQVELFKELGGNKMPLTLELCVLHAQKFDWEWASRNLLSSSARGAYTEAKASESEAYTEAMASAWKAYNEAIAPVWKAYTEAIAPARKAYTEAAASAWKAYNEATAPVRKAYNEAKARAFFAAWSMDQ